MTQERKLDMAEVARVIRERFEYRHPVSASEYSMAAKHDRERYDRLVAAVVEVIEYLEPHEDVGDHPNGGMQPNPAMMAVMKLQTAIGRRPA